MPEALCIGTRGGGVFPGVFAVAVEGEQRCVPRWGVVLHRQGIYVARLELGSGLVGRKVLLAEFLSVEAGCARVERFVVELADGGLLLLGEAINEGSIVRVSTTGIRLFATRGNAVAVSSYSLPCCMASMKERRAGAEGIRRPGDEGFWQGRVFRMKSLPIPPGRTNQSKATIQDLAGAA